MPPQPIENEFEDAITEKLEHTGNAWPYVEVPAGHFALVTYQGESDEVDPVTEIWREGQIVPDAFLGEQTMITNVRGRGLVVVTSCSHRGIVGICRHAARITGVPKVHAVIGGFHLSGLREERVTRVVDAFRDLEVDWIVPQHCTGLEAMASMMHRLPREMVPSSVGSVFTFGR